MNALYCKKIVNIKNLLKGAIPIVYLFHASRLGLVVGVQLFSGLHMMYIHRRKVESHRTQYFRPAFFGSASKALNINCNGHKIVSLCEFYENIGLFNLLSIRA